MTETTDRPETFRSFLLAQGGVVTVRIHAIPQG